MIIVNLEKEKMELKQFFRKLVYSVLIKHITIIKNNI